MLTALGYSANFFAHFAPTVDRPTCISVVVTTGAAATFHGRALKFGSGDLESRELSFENVIFVFIHAQFT